MNTGTDKAVYSVHDIARICQEGHERVFGWLQDGLMEYFTTPGGHYRVPNLSLKRFIEEKGLKADFSRVDEKYRVLVVEDDTDMLDIIADLLMDEEGLEVRKEDNGFNAGLQIASWHPDLILLDFVMPGMNGFDVCKQLRQNAETADIAVLALTGLSTFENRKAVMDAGVSEFLGKPFRSQELLEKVRLLPGIQRIS